MQSRSKNCCRRTRSRSSHRFVLFYLSNSALLCTFPTVLGDLAFCFALLCLAHGTVHPDLLWVDFGLVRVQINGYQAWLAAVAAVEYFAMDCAFYL
jgi:hypothetical protein